MSEQQSVREWQQNTQLWYCSRVQLKCNGTRWRTGGEVKGKLANGVGSQYPSHYLGTLPPKFSVALNLLSCTNHCQIRSSATSVQLFFHNRFSEGLWCRTKVICQRLEKLLYLRWTEPASLHVNTSATKDTSPSVLCDVQFDSAAASGGVSQDSNWIKTGAKLEVVSSRRRKGRLRHAEL